MFNISRPLLKPRSSLLPKIDLIPQRTESAGRPSSFEILWQKISLSLDKIEEENDGSFEELFKLVESMTKTSNRTSISNKLMLRLSNLALNTVKSLVNCQSLKEFVGIWNKYKHTISIYDQIFIPWQESDPVNSNVRYIINDYAIKYFKESNIENILNLILEQIRNIHERKPVDESTAEAIDTVLFLGRKTQLYESIIAETTSYYSNYINEYSILSILPKIQQVLDQETVAIKDLFSSTLYVNKYIGALCPALYGTVFRENMTSFLNVLIDKKDFNAIRLLANLVEQTNDNTLIECFVSNWNNIISTFVNDIYNSHGLAVITELIDLQNLICEFQKILGDQYSRLFKFFRREINKNCDRTEFLLAKFCHQKILSNSNEFSQLLPSIIQILQYLENLDQFIGCYIQFYACRYINYATKPPAVEESTITTLKSVCGDDKFNMCYLISSDYDLSSQITSKFVSNTKFQFRCTVMKYDSWPSVPYGSIPDLPEISEVRARFEEFYMNERDNVSLKWLPLLEECTITYKKAKIIMSAIQASIFYHILKKINVNELNIPKKLLQDSLLELTRCGLIVRSKTQNTYIAANFKPTKNVINICQSLYAPRIASKRNQVQVYQSRKPALEALIVRILKQYGPNNEQTLFEKVNENGIFEITKDQFMLSLESLLSREMIMLSLDNTYIYGEMPVQDFSSMTTRYYSSFKMRPKIIINC